jgi:hypothetical protein
MSESALANRAPGSLAERFWSIAKATGPSANANGERDPHAVARHVLGILDALAAGQVGDGLSHSTMSFLQLLRVQELAGDLSYASPEQARGESLDERSLVFSVGVLIFEELTGRHPFGAAASGRRLARIQKCELGSGVQFFPQVPAQLRNLLMKAMGPFPEERYRSLHELRVHLERFVEGRPDETPVRAPRRPLRGLVPTPADLVFGSPDDLAPTTVKRRPEPPPGKAPLDAPDRGVRAISVMRAQAVPVASVHNSTDKVVALRGRSRAFAVVERVAYVACGALLALLVAYLILRDKGGGRLPSNLITHATLAPVPEPTRNVEPPPGALATPTPLVFDAELGGRNAAKSARDCFEGDRAAKAVTFGAGLLFNKDDALARRAYLSPDEPLSAEERRCVTKAMVGASGGAAPGRNTIVEYRFRLRPDGTNEVRTTIQK